MGKVLIVGCGGVASVAVHKCCQNSKVFDAICIASRTVSKCEALKENCRILIMERLQQHRWMQITQKN